MADIPNPTFDNIPRLTPTVESYHYRQPLFRSPENGPIVELFDGVFHAHPITDEMLEEGRWMAFADFQRAAPDAGISIPASSRGFSYVFYRQYVRAIHESRLAGFSHPHIPPYRYDGWGGTRNPSRRSQVLLSTQAVWDAYSDIQQHGDAHEKRYKFLRAIEVFFDIPTFDQAKQDVQDE